MICKHVLGIARNHELGVAGNIVCVDCGLEFDLDDAPDGMHVCDDWGRRREFEHPDPRTEAEKDLDEWQTDAAETIESVRPGL
uniref:Uncharacterized protein n=1 Tax=viral metagenome TaxID=1070528 RepID=A0A6H1Z9K5_9ZZZZ